MSMQNRATRHRTHRPACTVNLRRASGNLRAVWYSTPMQTDDKREKLQARIAEDLNILKSMLAEDDTLVQGYLRMIATGKASEAREVL